jgi:hypothetical protein
MVFVRLTTALQPRRVTDLNGSAAGCKRLFAGGSLDVLAGAFVVGSTGMMNFQEPGHTS